MLSTEEKNNIKDITGKYYMKPVLSRLDELIEEKGNKEALSYLHDTILDAKDDVMKIIEARKDAGDIKDVSQASKTVVGAIFSNSIVYLFLKAKEQGLVKPNVFITTKLGKFKDRVAIKVDGETQKPDMDLVLYGEDVDSNPRNMMIISLKTSLRERAGQTYKWKLLLEIATSDNPIRQKYNIDYPLGIPPLVCFATINFYDEINNPQHRGMFKFFDRSFIGKPIKADFIDNLSQLVDYANDNLA
ncbi:MAG: BsaWI family type II restriction enzyme [Candidatus Saccharimonadales bacterium]